MRVPNTIMTTAEILQTQAQASTAILSRIERLEQMTAVLYQSVTALTKEWKPTEEDQEQGTADTSRSDESALSEEATASTTSPKQETNSD